MCLQAYDFVELNRRYGCVLQMGGSDQWGNIVTGIDLGRRLGTPQLYALTSPLITTASGAKMGKTAAGAVWLDAAMLSPYDYWQFWRNTEDADVGRFLKLFTLLPLDEIARLAALQGAEINEAKKMLANEATALLHGARGGRGRRRDRAQDLRGRRAGREPADVEIPAAEFDAGLGVLTAFVRAGLVASTGEARRQIKRRRLARQRRGARPTRRRRSAATRCATASSSCRSAARSTCCCGRSSGEGPPAVAAHCGGA